MGFESTAFQGTNALNETKPKQESEGVYTESQENSVQTGEADPAEVNY